MLRELRIVVEAYADQNGAFPVGRSGLARWAKDQGYRFEELTDWDRVAYVTGVSADDPGSTPLALTYPIRRTGALLLKNGTIVPYKRLGTQVVRTHVSEPWALSRRIEDREGIETSTSHLRVDLPKGASPECVGGGRR